MRDKVLRAISRHNMINEGDTVAVCLSGGADSMSLFHFLCVNRDFLKIKVMALHVNHGLRDESRREEDFVKDYCRKMGVKCLVYRRNMRLIPLEKGVSTEMWARDLRYRFFFEQAKKYNAKLATAHTASDRRETVLFNITRGSSLKGAGGIPPVRDNIIRPLIYCTRADTEKYCADNGIPYVTDMTNFSDRYSRNRIRLNVIPQLEKINSAAVYSISSFADEAREIYTLLTQLSDTLYKNRQTREGFDTGVLLSRHPAVAKNLVRNILDGYGCLSKDNVNTVYSSLSKTSGSGQLSNEWYFRIRGGILVFYKKRPPNCSPQPVNVKIGEEASFGNIRLAFSLISREDYKKAYKSSKKQLTYYANCDKIYGNLFLRSRKAGDRITLPGRNVTKTLKKLFTEDKIPLEDRELYAVLSDEKGEVIWLSGYGTNKPYLPVRDTESILMIRQM